MEETNLMQPSNEEEMQHTEQENIVEETAEQQPVDVETNTEEAPVAEPQADEQPTAEEQSAPEAEKEPEVNYEGMNREELVAAFTELMQNEVHTIKNRVAALRNRFNELNREVQKAAYEAFLAEGGNKDDYEEKNDGVAEAFHRLYDQYRVRRQQYM